MRFLFVLLLLLVSCASIRVSAFKQASQKIMMCGNALTNFDDIEEEATYICGYKKTVLECVYKQDGYASGIPIRKACCVIVCPDYKLWRKND